MRAIYKSFLVAISVALLESCGGDSKDDPTPINCDSPPAIAISAVTNSSTCASTDGSITVSGSGGTGALEFSIDGTNFQSSADFNGLSAGTYTLTVRDENGCSSEIQATVNPGDTDLAATLITSEDNECLSDNGSIEVVASGGVGPYQYNIGDGFTSTTTFTGLGNGQYTIIVMDAEDCSISNSATVSRGDTGVSYATDVSPIIMTNCVISGCHNGDNGANRNWSNFSNVQANAANIKTMTQNGSMPQTGSLTQDEIDLIACWVDDGAKDN